MTSRLTSRAGHRAGLRVAPPARLRLARCAGPLALGLAALGALLAAGPAGAVGLPRPGIAGLGDRLTVTYEDGGGRPVTRTLACGDVVAAEEQQLNACRRLEELGGPLAPVPTGQMCSMIYGGPQTARVTGLWHGMPIDETYRRTDGCEVARWNRMVPVLPSPVGGTDGRMLAT